MKFDADKFKEFFDDLAGNGFHIFSRENTKKKSFHPNPKNDRSRRKAKSRSKR